MVGLSTIDVLLLSLLRLRSDPQFVLRAFDVELEPNGLS
jgi:hypothetical protein